MLSDALRIAERLCTRFKYMIFMKNYYDRKKAFLGLLSLIACLSLLFAGCSDDGQFSKWETRTFPKTMITESSVMEIPIVNGSDTDEQHVRAIGLNQGADAAGHFQIISVKVDNHEVNLNDIVIPPAGRLIITIGYAPLNMTTSVADYGGWETGYKPRWIPGQEPMIIQRFTGRF